MNQLIFLLCSICIAVSNIISAIFVYKFVKETVPRIQNMDRAMRVIKYDILKRKSDALKRAADGAKIRENVKIEDSLK